MLLTYGEYQEAGRLFEETVCVQAEVLGFDFITTVQTRSRLAWVSHLQGEHMQAEILLRGVIDLQRRDAIHDDRLWSESHLAKVLSKQGRHDEAEELLRSVISSQKILLGAEDRGTLWSKSCLAAVYSRQGKYEDAAKLAQQTVALQEKILGPGHPDTLESKSTLASAVEDPARALRLLLDTANFQANLLGDEHPETLETQFALALALIAQGDFREAEVWLRQVKEVRLRVSGADHPETLVVDNCLADWCGPRYWTVKKWP
ncbi:hypothetical protein NKR23_g8994 [Pleurostoma richardsiae]|uniref:Kinesin light chain n=1 Tax=Pleurostoma richardsiae TaxID=41990 RepID=A0AA38RH79_9PEZI|nr:hypothetical protein NKR23_g8994 [Pleurostoma richardsiae]